MRWIGPRIFFDNVRASADSGGKHCAGRRNALRIRDLNEAARSREVPQTKPYSRVSATPVKACHRLKGRVNAREGYKKTSFRVVVTIA